MTHLPKKECAIVSTNGMRGLELLLPEAEGVSQVPDIMAFLIACAMRFERDPAFVAEQIAWLETQVEHERKLN